MRCPICDVYYRGSVSHQRGCGLPPYVHLLGVLGGVIGSFIGFTVFDILGALVGGLLGIGLYVVGASLVHALVVREKTPSQGNN